MRDVDRESLSYDPIHGYIPFTASRGLAAGEVSERSIIDHPWVQRLRQIHQLQTAWWVYPSAAHSRFEHVLGVMHLASRATAALYESLQSVCPDAPSRGYVESLLRLAGLLHDVGHGPFGHFFDEHFLADFGLTHETVGGLIIREELGDLIRGVRRNPYTALADGERLDPDQIAFLITRPKAGQTDAQPRWLRLLQSLLSGIYTIDNMDFVLRDAYMSGYSTRAFDLDRLLNYSFFCDGGLAIHQRALDALLRFMSVRAELFRSVYFHRTVRAIDLMLKDLFRVSKKHLFPGSPLEHRQEYLALTDWSLLVDVSRWAASEDPERRSLGEQWRLLLGREIPWKMVCQRHLVFARGDLEKSSMFSDAELVAAALRKVLPPAIRDLPLRVDLARHLHRPDTRGPAAGLNFMFDPARGAPRPLTDDQLFEQLPLSHRICRLYAQSMEHAPQLAAALDALLGPAGSDDVTNM
ncbi:MAG: HD domain-containing protein [Pirellulales bacterium]